MKEANRALIPPNSKESEMMVLGCMLTSVNSLNIASDALQASDFYHTEHQIIFDVLKTAYKNDKPADVHLVCEELKRQGKLKSVGGAAYITSLAQYAGTAAFIEEYVEVVQNKSILRRMIHTAQDIEKKALEDPQDVHDALDEAQQKLFIISQAVQVQGSILIKDILSGLKATSRIPYLKELQQRQEEYQIKGPESASITGLPTHFIDLDKMIDGFGPSNLIILAARPAMGKCVTADTEILDPTTGLLHPIKKLVEQKSGYVATLSKQWTLETTRPTAFIADGIKPVFSVKTSLGKTIEATAAHPFLTISGWKRLEEIKSGEWIAVPRTLPYFGTGKDIPSASLEEIPDTAFSLDKEHLALFLGSQLALGLSIEHGPLPKALYHSSSSLLLRQMQHLLLRFGILSKNTYNCLLIEDLPSLQRLCQEIPLPAAKQLLSSLPEHPEEEDLIPGKVWDLVLAKKDSKDPLFTNSKGQPIRRQLLLEIGTLLQAPELLEIAKAPVYWDPIVSITPTGNKEVYDLTVEPSHNFVAADFFVHNTALALNIAENICFKSGLSVGVFSLEMSAEQLLHRLICSQAEIESDKLRTGSLNGIEFQRVVAAVNAMQKTTMVIDDQPGLKITDLRARARRMKETHGISFLIVDYLQLLSGSGASRSADSRQNEISEISRMLKNLARELNIPVLCLSQLSRKVEERPGHRPMMSDLRESGCLAGSTLIQNAETQEIYTIKDLSERAEQTPIPVIAVNEDLSLSTHLMTKVFYSGKKILFALKTNSGKEIEASANHPFFTKNGWQRLDALKKGDLIGMSSPEGLLWEPIAEITPKKEEDVYDATVDTVHNFTANGFIVHNSIEQDSDVVIFLLRREYYDPYDKPGLAEVIVAKNRHGGVGSLFLTFRKELAQFANYSPSLGQKSESNEDAFSAFSPK